jgi:hypothetical protein
MVSTRLRRRPTHEVTDTVTIRAAAGWLAVARRRPPAWLAAARGGYLGEGGGGGADGVAGAD